MMNETSLVAIAGSLVATLFGMLTIVVGWMGSRVIEKLDDVVVALGKVEAELHARISRLDLRVTAIETRCSDQLANIHIHQRDGDR